MGSFFGNKIKEIRKREGLTQQELANILGYSDKSMIAHIENGDNEMSNDKITLLLNIFNINANELFDVKKNDFNPIFDNANLFISFSARENGNSIDIAKSLMAQNDKLIMFKDLRYTPCSNCNYECFSGICKYRNDDIYSLIDSFSKYKKIVFIIPIYCSNPPSIYFSFNERMQDYYNHNEEKYSILINKLFVVGILGSQEETPYFSKVISEGLKSSNRLLLIERHKHNLKMSDKIIEDDTLNHIIKDFKSRLYLSDGRLKR